MKAGNSFVDLLFLYQNNMKKISANGKGGKKDIAASYNKFKFFGGKQYTGMKVGRSHKWYYDSGVWVDKKITPEKWQIRFEVKKRRAGKAPEGSGAPVGTEYHWYIMAHQVVKKLDANTYSTAMNGFKFKLAHKRSTKGEWNINDKAQQKQLIKILSRFIEELERGVVEEVQMPAAIKKGEQKKTTRSENKDERKKKPAVKKNGAAKKTARRKKKAEVMEPEVV